MVMAHTLALKKHVFIPALFVSSRALVLFIGFIAFSIFPQRGESFHKRATSEVLDIQAIWNKFDCTWYQSLAHQGYPQQRFDPTRQSTWGFMPLYPLLIKAATLIVGQSYFWIGIVISNLCTLAALYVIYILMTETGHDGSRVLALLMLAGGTFYLSIVYTEGLFLLLTALVFWQALRKNHVLALLFAGLGAITRIHGFLLFILPIFEILKHHRLRSVKYLPALAVSLTPLAALLIYLYVTSGDALAIIDVQVAWGSVGVFPFQGLRALFNSNAALGTWVNTFFGAISIGILIKQRRKFPVSYLVFALMFVLISTSNEYIYGMTRYTIPLIPLYIAVVESSEILYQTYMVLNIAFLAINIAAFVTGAGTFI